MLVCRVDTAQKSSTWLRVAGYAPVAASEVGVGCWQCGEKSSSCRGGRVLARLRGNGIKRKRPARRDRSMSLFWIRLNEVILDSVDSASSGCCIRSWLRIQLHNLHSQKYRADKGHDKFVGFSRAFSRRTSHSTELSKSVILTALACVLAMDNQLAQKGR